MKAAFVAIIEFSRSLFCRSLESILQIRGVAPDFSPGKTGAVCVVVGVSCDGVGPAATRAKALNLGTGAFSAGLKARSPGLKSGATPHTG